MADLPSNEAEAEAAFETYKAAQVRVMKTLHYQDGIAAGRAFRRFLDLFLTPEQRRQMDAANVVPLRRRA